MMAGLYHKALASRKATHFLRQDRKLISLVWEELDGGPFHIVALPGQFREVGSIAVTKSHLIIEGTSFALQNLPRFPSQLSTRNSSFTHLRENLFTLQDFLILCSIPEGMSFLVADSWPEEPCTPSLIPLRDKYREGARLLRDGLRQREQLNWGAASLKGLGPGLTPSGDDFLSGVLAGLYLFEYAYHLPLKQMRDELLSCALGDNPISNALLRSCAEGNFFRRLKNLLEALLDGDNDAVVAHASRMLEFGATSGRDLSTGLSLVSEWLFLDPVSVLCPYAGEVETVR